MIYSKKKLGEVCKVVGGGTPSTIVRDYWGGDIAWVTPKDLGQLSTVEITNTTKKLTQLGVDNSSAKLLPAGSVILSSRAPIGYVAINAVSMATNQGCRNFICSESIFNKYLYYFLISSRDYLQTLGSGSTFLEVSGSRLKEIEIPIPTIMEQRRIVERIEKQFVKIDEIVRLRTENLAVAATIIPATLHEIFSSVESKEWRQTVLGKVCDIVIGGTPRRGVSEFWQDGTLPWVSIADLSRNGKFVTQTKEKITPLGVKKSNVKLVPRGTLMMSFKLSLGKLAFAETDLYTNEAIAAFKIEDKEILNPEFLYYILQTATFTTASTAVKGKTLNKGKLQNLPLILPSLAEQKRIVKKLDALSEKVKSLQDLQSQQFANLTAFKQSILYQAFNY